MKDSATVRALIAVEKERIRQDAMWGDQTETLPDRFMTILTEEVGEAAHAILDEGPEHLREELVQVAAVAVAFIESLDKHFGVASGEEG